MKECFYFPTLEKQDNVVTSLDESYIFPLNKKRFLDILDIKIYKTIPSDPIKQKLSELTGAKWYGDYVVYSNPENCIVRYFTKEDKSEWITSLLKQNMIYSNIKFHALEFYLDPFNEYSLFLQGKENKWDEVKSVLGI